MFSLELNNLGKKFRREWIFRGINLQLDAGEKLVIQGSNGSGKSTLLQLISGFLSPSEGKVLYHDQKKIVEREAEYRYLAYASPYLQLPEDFTLEELFDHCRVFTSYPGVADALDFAQLLELERSRKKYLSEYSSGMRQRVKLGLALLSDCPLLLLDEPLSNLDRNGIAWYKTKINTLGKDRTIIVCSNAVPEEHAFCTRELNVMDFKV